MQQEVETPEELMSDDLKGKVEEANDNDVDMKQKVVIPNQFKYKQLTQKQSLVWSLFICLYIYP